MAQKHRFHNNRQKQKPRGPQTIREAPAVRQPKVVVEYGKPFVLMEDEHKNTFDFKGGKWIPHPLSIAECRQTCLVKELAQKVKGMTRYEIQSPLPVSL